MVAHVGAIAPASSSFFPSLPRLPRLSSTRHRPFAMAAMSDDPIREWILSEGKATEITRISSVGGGCINRANRYDTDAGSFFVKTNRLGRYVLVVRISSWNLSNLVRIKRGSGVRGKKLAEMHKA